MLRRDAGRAYGGDKLLRGAADELARVLHLHHEHVDTGLGEVDGKAPLPDRALEDMVAQGYSVLDDDQDLDEDERESVRASLAELDRGVANTGGYKCLANWLAVSVLGNRSLRSVKRYLKELAGPC